MLFKKASEYCCETGIYALLREADTVIVGFSGGADSSVLLSFFISVRKKFPSLKIIAAHVNHMIRGEEADRDEDFCRNVCERYGIPIEIAHIDIPSLSEKCKKGLEETARNERYSFFESLSQKYPHSLIATAHNADDNLETVIFNLCRGSGTKGLAGISPLRDNRFIRPLLSCTSEEIRTFADKSEIAYVKDSTNGDTAYTRNSIRSQIVPLLRAVNPKVSSAALRLSSSARSDCDLIEEEAKKIFESRPLTRDTLRTIHPALFSRILLLLYREKTCSVSDLSEKNISDCRKLIDCTEGGSISLPRGLAFFADKHEVYIAKDPRFQNDASEIHCSPILLRQENPVSFFDFCILLSENGNHINIIDENVYNLSLHEHLDCDKINGELFVRNRRPGDTIKIRGMNRKLKKLLCDKDIPKHLRAELPVIEDSEGILFVPFIGARDGTTPKEDSKMILNLHIFKRS